MAAESDEPQVRDLERRLFALERAVEKMRAPIDPLLAVSNLAGPIAGSLLKIDGQHSFSARFFALLDLGEAVLKYAAAIAFALVTQANASQAVEVVELFKRPPTLGKIVERLRKILADSSAPTMWPMNLVNEAFYRQNGKQTPAARYLFEEFIAIRNSERGHGAQQPEGYYEERYVKNRSILEDIALSTDLFSASLVHVHSIDHHIEQYSYKVTRLMGAFPIGIAEPIITPKKVRMHSTCLWDKAERLLPLDDFVVYRFCKHCSTEHTFFADSITDNLVNLQSYPGSHRMDAKRL